jgi:hypothetical protein
MGIADLFRPKYRHSDVRVRTEAIRALTNDDAAILIQVAKTDRDIGVRRLAIEKIHEADVLAELAAVETERSLRDYAGERAAELWQDIACGADNAEKAGAALTGIIKIGEQHALVEVAAHASLPAIRKRAFGELRDPRALSELAKGDAPQELRLAAVARIDDGDVLRALAIDTTQKEVGLAAVDKLDDLDRLENVASKAKNKAVRQRARKIALEMTEAEKKKLAPVVPDEVKRLRAERAQLIREVENVADSFDFDRVTPLVEKAETAWKALPTDAEASERFTRSAERFWRRKELHQSQARSTDELRAVEREAARERERAAAERAAAAPPPVAAPVETAEARAEREVEETARREERDRRKAEDDTRRAAETAERETRRLEDVERNAVLAQNLVSLVDDLEKLESKDLRQLDRALQQAGRAFEQIGRVAAETRDALAERYSAARNRLTARVNELREAEDWERFQNVPKAEALIAAAKSMAAEEPSQDLANRLRQLQALWKEVGPMPQRRSKELWDLFKVGCDAVYDRVKGFREIENEKFAEVIKVKEALIAEAEQLAESTDWATTADKLKALQGSWKDSGHLPRKQGDELWKRFRAACDKFFERRKPMLDARHAEEGENLAKKQELIARAHQVALKAPADGGWGKAIGQIKDLQREWQDIGYVPRRDADAVYKAFRAACDSLFAKRDESRDAEANTHRAELDALRLEITAVETSSDVTAERVTRAIAVRKQVRELDRRELSLAVEQMVRAVIASVGEVVKGTELDPTALFARRTKLIGKAEELLPKTAPAPEGGLDLAAQLKNAMRSNAFGDLRFSGRDPVEVIDELRAQWADAGPLLEDADRAQATEFEDVCKRVLDAANASAPVAAAPREERGERGERGGRRRRERQPGEQPANASQTPAPAAPVVVAPVVVAPVVVAPVVVAPVAAAPVAVTHDMPTAPAKLPFEPLPPPPVPAPPIVAEAPPEIAMARTKSVSVMPPMDDVDTAWDLGDDDPTASKTEKPATQNTPGSSEMAGDGATGGDGIDEPGWD